ncbi:MAG: tetratricopeptide repeat protein [Leptospirillia bacterium]
MNRKERRAAAKRGGMAAGDPTAQTLTLALQHHNGGRLAQAEQLYRQVLNTHPEHPDALHLLGVMAFQVGRYEDAAELAGRAVLARPKFAEAHNNQGIALRKLERIDDAIKAYRNALRIQPKFAGALNNLANALKDKGDTLEAIETYRKAVKCQPDFAEPLGQLLHQQQQICQWDEMERLAPRVIRASQGESAEIEPLMLIGMETSAEQQYRGARTYVARRFARDMAEAAPFPAARTSDDRITVGYLSGDFRTHPVAQLTAELFERHDRARFRVFGYSYGQDDGSPLRARLEKAFDRFTDLRAASFAQAVEKIRADGVDILVDLAGHTKNARTGILARRAAPVQVNYLGYPGTMGANFMDYIVADDFVVPTGQQPFFSERLVHLPHSFQVNDGTRTVTAEVPPRSAYGLPEEGVVFCCFNTAYKITPRLFEVWMRLLAAVPGSVLWLSGANPHARKNLMREAAARRVDPARLVFAEKLPELSDHLARHRLADLFLDTLPYNAHTTASDALWGGCPVLTCAGDTFASRVAGSLLRCLGLTELITHDLAAYEARALELARNPAALADIKERLAVARAESPLFDCGRFTRNLEAGYQAMWDTHRRGRPPAPIRVTAEGQAETG